MLKLSLDGKWKFTSDKLEYWLEGSVPGDVFSDLIENDEIVDPYYGKNELDLQWIGKSDWTYRRKFELESSFLEKDKLVLDCRGIDTVASIRLNGALAGTAENMHRRYEYEVGHLLEEGENEIKFEFRSPVEYGQERAKEYDKNIPDHRYQVDQPARQFVRKAQCHYGWDWGPCFPTMGIWRDIQIVGFSAPRVRYTVTEQEFHQENVTVDVRVGFDAPKDGEFEVDLALGDEEITERVFLGQGNSEEKFSVKIENPDLWWPAGYGEQNMYQLRVITGKNSERQKFEKRIGLRDLELVREEDRQGESFFFEVNGTPVFAKGANWIPADSFYGRMTESRYENLLDSAVEANMNSIRIWGGGLYENKSFYELCDEKGILIWQDFMFACSAYPADEAFLENAEMEVKSQVRRLADHPSIALWCGNNENEWLGDRGDYDSKAQDWEDLFEDYQKLNQGVIESKVQREDPGRTFWPSSPSSDGRASPNDESIGDIHYWNVWHGEKPFSDYLSARPRFVSEFGYQSFPSPDLLLTVMEEEDLNPTSPVMEHHQRHPEGNSLIASRMADHFRFPFSFEDFVYLSQIQQGMAMKIAIEHWRRLKPYCMGTIYWQLNDIWPVASWSSLEYGGGWKALHHMAKRFYAPIISSVKEKGDELEVWVTSDVDKTIDGLIEVEVVDFQGHEAYSDSWNIGLPSLSSRMEKSYEIKTLLNNRDPAKHVLRTKFNSSQGVHENFHFLERFKSLKLPDTKISTRVDGNRVCMQSELAALFVQLEAPDTKGHFEENYFHLPAGINKEVEFKPVRAGTENTIEESNLKVKHLRGTY